MHKIAEKRRRFGYPLAGSGLPANLERRRVGIMLESKGMIMNEIGARKANNPGDRL